MCIVNEKNEQYTPNFKILFYLIFSRIKNLIISSKGVISQKVMFLENDRSDSDCVTHWYGYAVQSKDWPPAGPGVYLLIMSLPLIVKTD